MANFKPDGIYITTEKKSATDWEATFHSSVAGAIYYQVEHTLYAPDGQLVGTTHQNYMQITLPRLWDITSPSLYTLRSHLLIQDSVVDEIISTFGFRTTGFNRDGKFTLNNIPFSMNLGNVPDFTQIASLQKKEAPAVRIQKEDLTLPLLSHLDQTGMLLLCELTDSTEVASCMTMIRNHPCAFLFVYPSPPPAALDSSDAEMDSRIIHLDNETCILL